MGLVHQLRLRLGRALAAVRLHQWHAIPESHPEWLSKRRTRLSEALIIPGNLYLALQGALSEVLPCEEWIKWELAIARVLGRALRASADRRGLEFPRLPGQCLEDLLRSDRSPAEKQSAVGFAARALWELHQKATADGLPLTHGDATARNVVVDFDSQIAHWFDFDTRHRLAVPAQTRCTDDVRAFLWSCAACIEPAEFCHLVETLERCYADGGIVNEVSRSMRRTRFPTVFELAQSPLSPEKLACLRAAVDRYAGR